MKQTMMAIGVAAALITGAGGCATTNMTEGDVALVAQDVQDVAREGTIVALSEKPEWRANITLVRDQLNAVSAQGDVVTFNDVLNIIQQLPIAELKSTEARLAITSTRIILRRAGRNVELGNIQSIRPVVIALATGISEGLVSPLAPHP